LQVSKKIGIKKQTSIRSLFFYGANRCRGVLPHGFLRAGAAQKEYLDVRKRASSAGTPPPKKIFCFSDVRPVIFS